MSKRAALATAIVAALLTGGRAATPIWTSFMRRALEGRPVRDFPQPDGVTLVRVDAQTGLLAAAGRSSRMEAFVAGTEPTRKAAPPEPAVDAASELEDGAVAAGASDVPR